MRTTALGTWRQPPLAYVVAELVISPYYSMTREVPALQDSLRGSFPQTLEAQELAMDGAKPSTQPLWRLLSADQQRGVQLGTRAISLHATSYAESTDFLRRWAEVLHAIEDAELGAFVERAGLRYIDVIVPSDGRSPADYLAHGLQGVEPEGSHATGFMWAAAFQFDENMVNLRAAIPAPQGHMLPPNFNALPLEKSAIMQAAEKRVANGQTIGFVDTDCIKSVGKVFDAEALIGACGQMQKLASRTFMATLSDMAKGEWV